MEFLSFVMALSPIIVVLVGILGFRQSAKKSGPGGPYMDAGAGSPAAIAAPFLVAPAFAIILGVYMVLTMLYTCVLFPHFGM